MKYINDKGDISPITGVQYILTQPNFSKGRPCHFFVVNKSEFEAATGFKQFSQSANNAEENKDDKAKAGNGLNTIPSRSHRTS